MNATGSSIAASRPFGKTARSKTDVDLHLVIIHSTIPEA